MLNGLKSIIILLLITVSGTALAVHINQDRTGQVVLFPYYTVSTKSSSNFITNFTVTNTTSQYKVVRVRLLDSLIGADLLNINLYLSPYDVWNATLRKNPDTGLPNLITEDESCTYPSKAGLQAGIDVQNPYTGITDDNLTEGYVEIIEMGVIADGLGPAADAGLYAEIDVSGSADGVINAVAGDIDITAGLLHDANGLPADCSVVADAWTAGAASTSAINGFEPGSMGTNGVAQDSGDPTLPYANNHNAGLVAPSGGINTYGIVINVTSGAAFVEEGVHIDRYATVAQHYLPDDPVNYRLPSLASGDIREAYITNTQGDGRKGDSLPLTEYDTGALHDISPLPSVPMGSNPLPIAMVLSAESVAAPFFVVGGSPGVNVHGETDIVLTFPMRKHGIFNGGALTNQLDANEVACIGSLHDGVSDGETVTLPTLAAVVQDFPHDGAGNLCTNAGFIDYDNQDFLLRMVYRNYEEQEGIFSVYNSWPGTPPELLSSFVATVSRSVNVISANRRVGGNQSVFFTPAPNVFNWYIHSDFQAGWVKFGSLTDYASNQGITALTEPGGGLGIGVSNTWTGVPVIGFSAMAADVGPAQLGETVELIRETNRD
ncbi:MAG: hypothetical protein KZQ87_03475 [Candidatus Thiodiazotropha sp. (ex Cardiolucina cf. quadrata)]|nr:hypothetical protein [Candidatus Thiodiazotropha sp. (ex Cardiolucina cf. quadrata)]